ncbi:hypothetical protein [Prosthecobacter sp.]|uniref:hypothetical protein n=1 Tax=Prosthecobacter sp. TaxID=1965333 RepID=UPI0037833E48
MFKPRHDEIHHFLEWRRQTRFIRHYGGPIMAVGLCVTGLWFVWQVSTNRRPPQQQHRTQMESPEATERARVEWRQREAEARMQRAGVPKPQAIPDSTLQASRYGGR